MVSYVSFNTASGRYYCNFFSDETAEKIAYGSFNTASGRYYCNGDGANSGTRFMPVSIPQAVGTIAIGRQRRYGVDLL